MNKKIKITNNECHFDDDILVINHKIKIYDEDIDEEEEKETNEQIYDIIPEQ